MSAFLMLADGSFFEGRSIGASGSVVGEMVFNTSMTGYQEIITDPSYARQIVVFTCPHIGNTGVNAEDMESGRAWTEGVVVRDCPRVHSSWRAERSLPDFLAAEGVVALDGVDTRRLARLIRSGGAQAGCISVEAGSPAQALDMAKGFPGLEGMDLAAEVHAGRQRRH